MTEITERDSNGRIKTAHLSPEDARRMQANRYTKAEKTADGSKAILAELGYSDDAPAPELVKNLAEIAVSQKTGAVSSIQTLLRIAHGSGDTGPIHVRPGEICPACGMVNFSLSESLARGLVELILKDEENRLKPVLTDSVKS